MPRLRDTPSDLIALVGRASDSLRLPQDVVEKDYWFVELLRSVSQPIENARIIFKGGTSLSKAHNLIQRFSQDLDILVEIRNSQDRTLGKGSIDGILKKICQRAASDLDIAEMRNEGSETGVHRNIRYHYPARTSAIAVDPGILLEIGRRGAIGASTRLPVMSYVSEYARSHLTAKDLILEEFSPVEIDVLAPTWTLVEKLASIHYFATAFEGMTKEGRERFSTIGRHYYDVHAILSSEEILLQLRTRPGLVAEIESRVRESSREWGFPHAARPLDGFARSPAFEPSLPCTEFARQSYARLAGLIRRSGLPLFEQWRGAIRQNALLL